MTSTTISSILFAFMCCGWPLLVHMGIVWIGRRDWSRSGEMWSQLISMFRKEDE